MKFAKGAPRPIAAGRKSGSKNKLAIELKAMILGALDDAGGQDYLSAQAHENPSAFMTLVGRCLPKPVDATHTIKREVTELTYDELLDIAGGRGERGAAKAPGSPESAKLH